MVNKLILFILIFLLVGCETIGGTKVKTEFKDKPVPVIMVPAPPDVKRPQLEIHRLTPEQLQSYGEVAKAATASVKQLLIYSEILEAIVNKYRELSKDSEERYNQLKSIAEGIVGPQAASNPALDTLVNSLTDGTPEDIARNLNAILEHEDVKSDFEDIQKQADEAAEKDYKD